MVLTVIGVLVSLITAATRSVRESGFATQCASNLRQLAAANLAYAADNGGQYCPAQDETNQVRWHGVRAATNSAFDAAAGPLAPYLGSEHRVKLCPALQKVLTGSESFEEGTGGYGYNAVYIGGTPGDYFTPERMANVARPAQTVMFADTALARAGGLQEYAFAEPWQWVDKRGRMRGRLDASVHFRHQGHANVAWCDGHVSAEKPSVLGTTSAYGADPQKWQLGWFGRSEENGYWNPNRSY